jgi:hypothetical protein
MNLIQNYYTNGLFLNQMIWFQIWKFEYFIAFNSKLQYKPTLFISDDMNSNMNIWVLQLGVRIYPQFLAYRTLAYPSVP